MNRRTFIQRSSLIVPGLALAVTGIMDTHQKKLFARNSAPDSMTLTVVTDNPDEAIALIQNLLDRKQVAHKNIRYTEYLLHGKHVADIAYTRSGRLIDFRKENESICTGLRNIATRLDLPRICENPLLACFSFETGVKKPTGIRVFKKNELIIEKSFPVQPGSIDLDGAHGKIVLEMDADRSVRIVETSCKHKTCMNMGSINQAGQNLVCIPNQITVTITGTDISGVDSTTF